jgi:hypothetical protein
MKRLHMRVAMVALLCAFGVPSTPAVALDHWDGGKDSCLAAGFEYERIKGAKSVQTRTCTEVILDQLSNPVPAPGNHNWTLQTETTPEIWTWTHEKKAPTSLQTSTHLTAIKCFNGGGEEVTGHQHCTEGVPGIQVKKK